MTTIKLKNGSGAPTAGDLVQGEPALDLTNKRLYTEDSGGTVIEVGTNPTSITTGDITATGTATFANLATSGDVTFGDNDKAIFGAGSDLQIYHDGTDSYVDDQGTGRLRLRGASQIILEHPTNGETYAAFQANGASTLYYDNAAKLATTSTGIDVTGTVTADGATIDGAITVNGAGINLDDAYSLTWGDGSAQVRGSGSSEAIDLRTASTTRLNIDADGDVSLYNSAGTSQDLFWDASTSRLGLGTTSPLAILHTETTDNLVGYFKSTDNRSYIQVSDDDTDTYIGAEGGSTYISNAGGALSSGQLIIDSSGNVVIGDSTAKTRLQSSGAGAANAPSLGSASSNAPLYLTNNDVAYGLVAGTNTVDGHAWLQAQRTDGTATAYNITLNEAGGNVGIGTASASNKLTVNGDQVLLANGELKFADATNNQVGTIRNSGSSATSQLEFLTASTERMRIDSSGNLLVGKTSSGIGTVGHELGATGYAYHTRDGGSVLDLNRKTSDGNIVKFYKDGTTVGSISVTASATTYNTSSDQRLKDNIVDAPSASDDIDAIQVRSFDWKADGSHQKYGMVAQELLTVAPDAVSEGDTEDDMMGVDYSKLVPMLVKEIQSLRARVAQLEGAN